MKLQRKDASTDCREEPQDWEEGERASLLTCSVIVANLTPVSLFVDINYYYWAAIMNKMSTY